MPDLAASSARVSPSSRRRAATRLPRSPGPCAFSFCICAPPPGTLPGLDRNQPLPLGQYEIMRGAGRRAGAAGNWPRTGSLDRRDYGREVDNAAERGESADHHRAQQAAVLLHDFETRHRQDHQAIAALTGETLAEAQVTEPVGGIDQHVSLRADSIEHVRLAQNSGVLDDEP